MATKKKKPESAPKAFTEDPTATAPAFGHEVYCSRCCGMVNFNGCADAHCPVKKP